MRSVRALAVALPIAFCGCGGSVPPTHFYVLEPQDVPRVEAQNTATTRGLTIGVETFRVDPPYDQDRIVYRANEGSAEVGFYAYHRWAAPLGRMLPGVVASAYSGVPGAKSIEPMTSGRSYDAFLRGRVLVFEEIDTADGPRIRVHVNLRLDASDGTQLWTATLSRDTDVSSNNVGSVVEQMRSELAEAIRESRPDLQSALQASH
jgi:ABC-type uncharacterized transport system auxiliary subunit